MFGPKASFFWKVRYVIMSECQITSVFYIDFQKTKENEGGIIVKRSSIYPALAIGLIFGLAIGLIPALPVYSDNLASCQGTGVSTVSLKLGGRVVSPTTILRTANGQACGTGEVSVNIVAMTRTLTVSPNGTATQNGTALLQAMSQISAANPSAANPWLLKLEPGNYDLGGNSLTLAPFVDLEGSGDGITVISSTVGTSFPLTQGTVILAANSEIRQVQVINTANGFRNSALVVPANATNVRVSQVNTIMQSTGTTEAYALYNNSGAITTIQNSRFLVSGAGSTNVGLRTDGGTLIVSSSNITIPNGTADYGISTFITGTITVSNSTISVSGGSSSNEAALAATNSTLTIQNSTLSATGANSVGIVNSGANTVRVGASGVSGSNGNTSGTMTCVASWTGSFAPLTC